MHGSWPPAGGARSLRLFTSLAAGLVLFGAASGSVASPAQGTESGELPQSSTLDGSFTCKSVSLRLSVRQDGRGSALAALDIDGKAVAGDARSRTSDALRGFTRVTGMSARCGRTPSNLVLIVQGHAGTEAARKANGIDDDDVGKRFVFERGALESVDAFPLD